MKVLFLDIDGVLNGHENHPGSAYNGVRADCMARLNRILEETGCKIVLSSAWRYIVLGGDMTLRGFEYLLASHGMRMHTLPRVLGAIGEDKFRPPKRFSEWMLRGQITLRGELIQEWLTMHPEVESWAVVDDWPDGIDLECVLPRLVRTDGKLGMTDADAGRLIRLLSGE